MLSQAKSLIPKPIDCIVLCRNGIADNTGKTIGDYAGDVRADKICDNNNDETQYVESESHRLPFFNGDKVPQILFIKPPLNTDASYNYLHSIDQTTMNNKTTLSQIINNHIIIVPNEIIDEIVSFLDIIFPIFISCASLYRGRRSFTHFTYPYSVTKGTILEYLRKCENLFDSMDYFYIAEFYLMKDDAPITYETSSDSIHNKSITVPFEYDKETLYRQYNKPTLVARKQSNKLKDIMRRNTGGGSFWLSIEWKEKHILHEKFSHDAMITKLLSEQKTIFTRIGGRGGSTKSRNWYQSPCPIAGFYLPMTVLTVCCGLI